MLDGRLATNAMLAALRIRRPLLNPAALALVALVGLWAGGCGGGAGAVVSPPAETLRAYETAIRERNPQALHALLDARTRADVTPEDLARLLEENAEELNEQATDWREAGEKRPNATARFPTEGGEEVLVALEEGRWRIDGNLLQTTGALSPRDAVLTLRRALARRDLESVLAVLSRESRAILEAQIALFIDETGDPLDFDVEIRGNTAWVRTSGGLVVELVREAGQWKVRELGHPSDPTTAERP